jgi:hypothetical protein
VGKEWSSLLYDHEYGVLVRKFTISYVNVHMPVCAVYIPSEEISVFDALGSCTLYLELIRSREPRPANSSQGRL